MSRQSKHHLCIFKISLHLIIFVIATLSAVSHATDELPIELKQQLLQGRFHSAATQLEVLVTQNNIEAKYQLAILLLNGRGINKSLRRAESLLRDSAQQSPQAAFLLGSLYFKGNQFAKDNRLAKRYLTLASESGSRRAQKMLHKIEMNNTSLNRVKPQTQRLFELAITAGNLSLVIKQYLNGANLNHVNDKGNTPLFTAIMLGRKDIALWLIKQKVDFNKKDKKGNTALHIAAKFGRINNAISIAKQLDDIDISNNNNQTPLMMAVIYKHRSVAQSLINRGANFLSKDRFGKSARDYNQISKLHLVNRSLKKSSANNSEQYVKRRAEYQIKSLKTQARSNESPYFKWPLITIAVAQGQINIAKSLLTAGHSPWKETIEHETAISLSLENNHNDLLDLMLDKYPIKQQTNQAIIDHLFFRAIEKGKTTLVKQLLDRSNQIGPSQLISKGLARAIKEKNTKSIALFLSLMSGKPSAELLELSIAKEGFKVTKQLIDKGAALNEQNASGKTPLILAALKGNAEVITLLLERKVFLEITDNQGLSALMWATKQNCLACVELLVLKGANPELASNTGNTSVMFAAQKSNLILKVLLRSRPDLSIRNTLSQTALMLAIDNNERECVATLLSHGANPRRKNSKGMDSFDLAKDKPVILSLLNER